MSRKIRVNFYCRPSGTVCFHQLSRCEDNGETDKNSCILIVSFLLKISSQWVNCVLGCVYIDFPTGEMKKKIVSSFINLAHSHMATACFLPSAVRHDRETLPKRKVRPSSNVDLFTY